MKQFNRTLIGKTLLFIICVASICAFLLISVGIALYFYYGLDFYVYSEEEIREKYVEDYRAYELAADVLFDYLNGEENTECGYTVIDEKGDTLASYSAGEKGIYNFEYNISVKKDVYGNYILSYLYSTDEAIEESPSNYTVKIEVLKDTDTAKIIELQHRLLHIAYELRYIIYAIALGTLLLSVLTFVALMAGAGRRPNSEEIHPGPFNKIPYDLILTLCGAAAIAAVYYIDCIGDDLDQIVVISLSALAGVNAFLGLCMSAASRVKQHTFLKNTLICWCLRLLRRILCGILTVLKKIHGFNVTVFKSIPLVWKTLIIVFGISFIEMIAILSLTDDPQHLFCFFIIEKVILIPAIIYVSILLRRLQQAGKSLASGDLSYKTDTQGMVLDFKDHAENLNSIAKGMSAAVAKQLKSERMKTELITNVSHDIKTPLTSIINYASLISAEPCENAKITEYSEVLVRQSEKLKRLIEDLVEASKASTGNLDVNLSPCDAAVFLSQAAGEFEDRLSASDLTLVTKYPDKELHIMADGRRMWRIFDNLMNNVCKYAMPGTRVYLSLEEYEGRVLITFRNTSREALNISEDELMERFTRGDAARNTDGNGLGLSIAASMAELQGGSMKLSVDGDLFKVTLQFPPV